MENDAQKLLKMFKALFEDAAQCLKTLEKTPNISCEDTQFWRRSFVRACCVFFEGLCAFQKQQAYAIKWNALDKVDDFEMAKLMLLCDKTAELNDKGEIYEKNAKIPTEKNILFAFTAFAEAHNSPFRLDRSSEGINNLRITLKVRDRLTHPKKLEDLQVSDEEHLAAAKASIWLNESNKKLLVQKG